MVGIIDQLKGSVSSKNHRASHLKGMGAAIKNDLQGAARNQENSRTLDHEGLGAVSGSNIMLFQGQGEIRGIMLALSQA